MRLPRFNFASCVYNDKIYAFGGFTKDSVKTNYIEEFDINSKTWTKSAISLTEKSCAGYAFVYNKNHICYIGEGSRKKTTIIYMIDFNKDGALS